MNNYFSVMELSLLKTYLNTCKKSELHKITSGVWSLAPQSRGGLLVTEGNAKLHPPSVCFGTFPYLH